MSKHISKVNQLDCRGILFLIIYKRSYGQQVRNNPYEVQAGLVKNCVIGMMCKCHA